MIINRPARRFRRPKSLVRAGRHRLYGDQVSGAPMGGFLAQGATVRRASVPGYHRHVLQRRHGMTRIPRPDQGPTSIPWTGTGSSNRQKSLKDLTGDGVPDVWGFQKWMNQPDRLHYWLAAAGSDFYGNEDKTVSTMDNPQAIQAIEFLRSLRWDARAVAPPGVEPSFIAGQAAIWEDGSWRLVEMLGRAKDGYPKVSFEWNVFPMPIGPSGKRYTLATTDGYAINRNTKHLGSLRAAEVLVRSRRQSDQSAVPGPATRPPRRRT